MIVLIDNYDSFTFNLVHYLGGLGAEVVVHRNDVPGLEELQPSHLVLSPGPGRPTEQLIGLVRDSRVPTLGVCLGHQAVVQAFGGEIGSARRLLHGKSSLVEHDGFSRGGQLADRAAAAPPVEQAHADIDLVETDVSEAVDVPPGHPAVDSVGLFTKRFDATVVEELPRD